MNVLLIHDSTSSPNWGDRAAAASLIAMIRATGVRIAHSVTEDELWSSTFGRTAPQSGGGSEGRARRVARLCTPPILLSVRRRILTRLDTHSGATSAAARLIPEKWEDFEQSTKAVLKEQSYGWPRLLQAIESADVVVIHGDQAMVGNGIVPRTDLLLTYLTKKRFGKPIVIVNHTADFDHPDLRRMAHEVYPLFDDVVFRDPISADRCAAFCNGRFAPDTAFWFEPASRQNWAPLAGRATYFDTWPNRATFDPSEPYLCLGGSSVFYSRPAERAGDFAGLVERIRSVYPGQIVLLASDTPDRVIFESMAAQLDLPLVGMTTPVQQAVDIIGNADAYVGGRWHTSIFALRGGAPVVPLSARTFKMQALMRSAGLPETTFDAFDLARSSDSLIRMLLDHLEGGDELRNKLRIWACEQAEHAWENVAYLRNHDLIRGSARRAGAQ